ncbi:MAG: 3-deoxy-8-phosphooctulonate synthase [Candidatus Omnitrophota bacterium]|jgi:2-dehydro-3-deoxyphosphooctonate aldolase (KDO 8-P synthase)|nr:MAG: 3-deoxy-8-phosphooctulonate synthase [Candidatus Omnitrophota bacterium]
MPQVEVNKIKIGHGNPLVLIAGPCVIENAKDCMDAAKRLKEIAKKHKLGLIFKSSFDKANRLSGDSFRGPGLVKGLEILSRIKKEVNVPILTDVHCAHDVDRVAEVADVIQIPAFLCRQTNIVVKAAKSGRVVNIKKGQFLAPWDMAPIIKKIEEAGSKKILITERGVSFGYNNLVTDFRALAIMRAFGYPVIFDATHSIQIPGGKGSCSGGQSEFVDGLSRAAVAFGCDGIFLEVHQNPKAALCDGLNMIDFKQLDKLLAQLKKIEEVL